MSGQVMWGKFAVMSAAIIAVGYGIMKVTTPTEQQIYDRLSPDLRAKVDKMRAAREQKSGIKDTLAAASQGDKDQIVWADQLGSTPGRKV